MEIGNNDPKERISSKEVRRKMIEVGLSVWTFWGAWDPAGVKQYLPSSPVIPLVRYDGNKNINFGVQTKHSDLITVQTLRGDSLMVPRKPEYNPDVFIPDPDFINIPSSFVKEGSYIVLLVPFTYSNLPEKGIEYYDTTILRINDGQLLKLTSLEEGSFRKDFNEFRQDKEKLYAPKELSDHRYELVTINTVGITEAGSVNIWMGNLDRQDANYKRQINGTVCYRMVEGKAERKQSRDIERSFKLVPQKAK